MHSKKTEGKLERGFLLPQHKLKTRLHPGELGTNMKVDLNLAAMYIGTKRLYLP